MLRNEGLEGLEDKAEPPVMYRSFLPWLAPQGGLWEPLFKVAMRDLGEVLVFVLNGVPYSSSRLELFEEPCRKLHMIM